MLYFYFDMDGVLAKFIHQDDFNPPLFMRLGSHYFLHREPDDRAIQIFQTLYHSSTPGIDVKVLTRVLDDSDDDSISPELRQEWWTDKRAWLLASTTGVDTAKCFIMAGADKGKLLHDIPQNQRKYHILIDDFNPNLMNWRKAGGTPVKYINELNNPSSFDGLSLLKDWTAEQCLNALRALQVLA